jgi:hypothetical protein
VDEVKGAIKMTNHVQIQAILEEVFVPKKVVDSITTYMVHAGKDVLLNLITNNEYEYILADTEHNTRGYVAEDTYLFNITPEQSSVIEEAVDAYYQMIEDEMDATYDDSDDAKIQQDSVARRDDYGYRGPAMYDPSFDPFTN